MADGHAAKRQGVILLRSMQPEKPLMMPEAGRVHSFDGDQCGRDMPDDNVFKSMEAAKT